MPLSYVILTLVRGRAFYDTVSGLLGNFLPPELRGFSSYFTAHNLKVWYDADDNREHYEVQVVSPSAVKDTKTLPERGVRTPKGRRAPPSTPMLEIGFHAEHKQAEHNEEVLDRLLEREKTWRRALGSEPEVGDFLGRQRVWRRISELWPEEEADELAVDAAERLAAYIRAIEPIRSDGPPDRRIRTST